MTKRTWYSLPIGYSHLRAYPRRALPELGTLRRSRGHGFTTVASTEPPMPTPETAGGHSRPAPKWKRHDMTKR